MKLDLLTAISPIDGRYRGKTDVLAAYFSEFALIKYRVQVEIEYFITLCELPLPQLKGVDKGVFETLRNIYRNFSEADAQRIKDIESVTNHDVKAVEYFLKEEFDKLGGMDDYKEFIHFGLTSQDFNNTSVPLSVKEALEQVYYPQIEELIAQLRAYAEEWAAIPMLAKTHGQPASPTRLGKEVMVFVYRLERQLATLKACPVTAKFGGATGNYNAHHVAYPEYDWKAFGNKFVSEKLGLEREEYTTQISNYDNLSAIFDAMKRINTVMIDMNRDFWQYISMEYFKQKIKAGEVGSSAMPHKVNPIDFENAEGNLGIANAILITDVMRFNAAEVPAKMGTFSQYAYPHCKERYLECANFLGIQGKNDDEKFENFLTAIEELKAKVGIKKTIKDYGVDEKYFLDTLDDMVEQAFDDQCTGANPRYPLMREIKEMYLKAYYGK